MIYLDHNATTELLPEAMKSMQAVLEKPFNASAVHSFGREGKKIIEHARKQVAEAVGINDNSRDYQITFTSSGTEANNLILSNFKEGEIFVSAVEHASILAHLKFANNIQSISVDKNGIVNTKDLIEKLSKSSAGKKLVSVIFANNETGVIQNIKEITEIVHSFDAIIHSDAVQAFGKIALDMPELDLDFITISAHKIGGPVGCGALIAKVKHHLLPFILGGGQERGLRSGTENIAAISGFGTAAEIANKRYKERHKKLEYLRDYLENHLKKSFPNIKIASEKVDRLPNTSLIIGGNKKAETQIIAFDLKDVAISSGAACSSGKIGSSATLAAMGFSEEEKASAIRVSVGFNNTKEDMDKFLQIYKEING